jgi:hypothetical protein
LIRAAPTPQRELVAFEGGEYDPAEFLHPGTVAAAVARALVTPPPRR